MANSKVVIREIRYRYDDSESGANDGLGLMHIYMLAECYVDCPHFVDGWYHKVFPADSKADDPEVGKSVANFLTEFDRGAP